MLNQDSLNEDWSESGITWNNAPGNTTNHGHNLDLSEVTHIGSFTTDGLFATDPAASPRAYNPAFTTIFDSSSFPNILTSINSALEDSDDNITFIVTGGDFEDKGWGFFSKEHDPLAAPILSMTGVIPEPSTSFTLPALILSGLVLNRRRK